MSSVLIETLTRFGDLMERENAALRTMDLNRAARLLAEKRELATAMSTFNLDDASASAIVARPLADRLRTLLQENTALLERAMVAQSKLLEIVTGAIESAGRSSYTAAGRLAGKTGPISLLERV
jgi:hypothetical protein